MLALYCEKALLACELDKPADEANASESARRFKSFAEELNQQLAEYENLWRARNKESELRRIRERLLSLQQEALALANRLESRSDAPAPR